MRMPPKSHNNRRTVLGAMRRGIQEAFALQKGPVVLAYAHPRVIQLTLLNLSRDLPLEEVVLPPHGLGKLRVTWDERSRHGGIRDTWESAWCLNPTSISRA